MNTKIGKSVQATVVTRYPKLYEVYRNTLFHIGFITEDLYRIFATENIAYSPLQNIRYSYSA